MISSTSMSRLRGRHELKLVWSYWPLNLSPQATGFASIPRTGNIWNEFERNFSLLLLLTQSASDCSAFTRCGERPASYGEVSTSTPYIPSTVPLVGKEH